MDAEFWKAAAAFLGSGGVGALAVKGWNAWMETRLQARMGRQVRAMRDIYDQLQRLLLETPAHRVLVLKLENGGGIPSISTPRYSSVIFEAHDERLPSIRDTWCRQRTDQVYDRLMVRLYEDGDQIMRVEELAESDVRDLYESQGVAWSHMSRIGILPTAIVYLSVSFCDGEMTPAIRNSIRIARTALSEIFRRHSDLHVF